MDICGPGRMTRWQLRSRPDNVWPELRNVKGRQDELSNKNPKLDNTRILRGIYLIGLKDKEFKETIKNARKKLETPMAPASRCRTSKKSKYGETCGKTNECKSKLVFMLEASESKRLRMGESSPNHHEGHIAGEGDKSLHRDNLVHKSIPMPQAMKIPAAKAAVDKEWEKLKKMSAWDLTKVRSDKEVIDEARTKCTQIHLASFVDICHFNAELETKRQKYKGRVVLRGDIVKDDYSTRIISITNDSSKSHGYHLQTARLRWTSSRRSIGLYPSRMEDAHNWLKIPKSEFRLPRHKWPKSWSSMEDPVVPLERNLYGHPLAGLSWERQHEKILLKHGWEKIPNWECLFVHREKGLFLSVYVDDKNWLEKNKTLIRCGNCSTKKSIWENQHFSLIMYSWDVLKDNVK